MNVRAYGPEQRSRIRLREDGDEIHSAQRGDYLRTLALRHQGATLALERSDLFVRVYPDHQQVSQCPRAFQVPYMPHVQQVKAAVSQDNARSIPPRNRHARNHTVAVKNPTPRIIHKKAVMSDE
jgi:hypothetical protein